MVHIKRVELTNFKSFGGTTSIPLLPVFTVISGPNGSGKSNILDALLFALGLSSSKGMRAERLPDLVNNAQNSRGTVEASVTVTFDLSDSPGVLAEAEAAEFWNEAELDGHQQNAEAGEITNSPPPEDKLSANGQTPPAQEWSVTRKLRVTKQGTYTSTYYVNGSPCTLTELHEQLNRLRVYPEGYNVVLQGDVTSIITMNPRERREIIDELAGVAAFDRKISQAKEKLDEVKDREERSRIVERELIAQRDRLAADRSKAEKYQKLRTELLQKEQWQIVLVWRHLQQQVWQLREHIEAGDRSSTEFNHQLTGLNQEIQASNAELDRLNALVKALGEEELISVQTTLATQDAEYRQLQNRQQELQSQQRELQASIAQNELKVKDSRQSLAESLELADRQGEELGNRRWDRDKVLQTLNELKSRSASIADASEAWVQQQTELHRHIETLQQSLDPQRTEQARLRERVMSLEAQIQEKSQLLQDLDGEIVRKQQQQSVVAENRFVATGQIELLTEAVAAAENELQTQQETQKRLLNEQREKHRQLDKLEAQAQAMQEASGTAATSVLVQAGLKGICGLVAQLGRVEPRYRLALEIAAGGRLGNLVVEDDSVAAAAIELLKQKRAGRATFLPLNKIRPQRGSLTPPPGGISQGFISYAVNLIECDPVYRDIFSYVFGNTAVFDNLNNARRFLGQYRIVTLEGELLETTGAMTGGSTPSGGSRLHFGSGDSGVENRQIAALKERLQEIEQILEHCNRMINHAGGVVKQKNQELLEAKQQQRESQREAEKIAAEINNHQAQQEQLRSQLLKATQELTEAENRLRVLDVELPDLEAQLQQYRQALADLEASQTHSEWQEIQGEIRRYEALLSECEKAVRQGEQRLLELQSQGQRFQERIAEGEERLQEYRQQLSGVESVLADVTQQLSSLTEEIAATRAHVAELDQKLGEEKQARDRTETSLNQRKQARQQVEWQLEKLQEIQTTRRSQLATLQEELQAKQGELPEPVPTVPENVVLEDLEKDLRSLQKRLQAMEPVNMLALEEYDRTQGRLDELSQKLATLEGERTELLLRIENFTTLRLRAFREAFDAVNENFQTIFAELSEGDGYLHLDDPEDPFSCGLNLVAHPKGKPVQRLASMSGGEKSLTALSFIFALQRYRPSPFYAFDEVDMFLDGANVERLAKMIKQQAKQAQFIVVSLRRPMIESSERTIGVTQARGAHTQVIGLKLQQSGNTPA